MVALIREPPSDSGGPTRRISLRSSQDEVDVSAIAAQGGRRRPPAGGRVLERALDRGDLGVHPAASSSPSLGGREADAAAGE